MEDRMGEIRAGSRHNAASILYRAAAKVFLLPPIEDLVDDARLKDWVDANPPTGCPASSGPEVGIAYRYVPQNPTGDFPGGWETSYVRFVTPTSGRVILATLWGFGVAHCVVSDYRIGSHRAFGEVLNYVREMWSCASPMEEHFVVGLFSLGESDG